MNRDHSRAKQLIQNVDIRRYARNQPADRISIEILNIELLQVRHDLAAEVKHRVLAGPLHQIGLAEIDRARRGHAR